MNCLFVLDLNGYPTIKFLIYTHMYIPPLVFQLSFFQSPPQFMYLYTHRYVFVSKLNCHHINVK